MKVTKHVEQLLGQGRNPKELIELGFPRSIVTRVRRQLKEEKAARGPKVAKSGAEAKSQAQLPAVSPEEMVAMQRILQSTANDLQKVDELAKALPELTVLMAVAQEIGTYRRETCEYQENGLCFQKTWTSRDEVPPGIGEPVVRGDENPEWYIKPSLFYCAMCPAPLEERIGYVEDQVSDDPLSGARYRFTCKDCGSKGWIAAEIKCTKCGRVSFWGWVPKKD